MKTPHIEPYNVKTTILRYDESFLVKTIYMTYLLQL